MTIDEFQAIITAAKPYYAFNAENRFYHNERHVHYALTSVPQSMPKELISEVFIALIWHDAIYVPKSSTNEASSAAAFEYEWTRLGIENVILKLNISWLIRYTTVENHMTCNRLEHQSAEAYVMDSDLSSLAMSYPEFLENQYNIIRENLGNPENPDHRRQSADFLHRLMNSRDYIYHTDEMRKIGEVNAKRNITRYYNEHS